MTQDELTQMIEQKSGGFVANGGMQVGVFSVDSTGSGCDTDCYEPTSIEDVAVGEQFVLQVTVPFAEVAWTQPMFCSGVDITVQVRMLRE